MERGIQRQLLQCYFSTDKVSIKISNKFKAFKFCFHLRKKQNLGLVKHSGELVKINEINWDNFRYLIKFALCGVFFLHYFLVRNKVLKFDILQFVSGIINHFLID